MNEFDFAKASTSPLAHHHTSPCNDEVHVWFWSSASVDDDAMSSLSLEERDRGNRFATTELRQRFAASHAGLRHILAGYLNCVASDLAFEHSSAGKPRLAGAAIQFNLSHSADANLLAVATTEVGVDIECQRDVTSLASLAARHFAGPELDAMRNSDDPLQSFFQTWTRKEAVIKLVGLGLATNLQDLDTSCEGEPIGIPAAWKFRKNCCWLEDLAIDSQHLAALATSEKPHTVRLFRGE